MSQNPQNDISSHQNEDNGRPKRPTRACALRAAQRLRAPLQADPEPVDRRRRRRRKVGRKYKRSKVYEEEDYDEEEEEEVGDEEDLLPVKDGQCSRVVTELVAPPEPGELPRWSIRSMWELASVLNFLHVFRPLLNIRVEFSAEELETALITPNDTLSDIHIPILKAIPPVTRMALTRDTWITILCRKLRDWWHWVAEGELPIVASHGAEIEVYKSLDPRVRVVILKALCDIRVEQEDIRSYIDNSYKHGIKLSAFRKERIGGDSHGISYWYEDDPVVGHRLYREIRKVEGQDLKKGNTRGSRVLPHITYLWETVATNWNEFQDVSEKLSSSTNRTEASLGKKLKNDKLLEIEKIHKRKERLLKKQQRQALFDNFLDVDGLAAGRRLRNRKPVTYSFDDYDRSINEAISITKQKRRSPEPMHKREFVAKHESYTNGNWNGPSQVPHDATFSAPSPSSTDYDDCDEGRKSEPMDRRNRRRQRNQRYSAKEFIEEISDNEADFDSDDDIVGEAVYDDEYLKKRNKRKNTSSSSELEGDEEYEWDDENAEEDGEEEDSSSFSEDSDEPRKLKKLPTHPRRATKLKSVDQLQSGLRRSKRSTRNQINYRHLELSDSETEVEAKKPRKSNALDEHSDPSMNDTKSEEYSAGSHDSEGNDNDSEMKADEALEGCPEEVKNEPIQPAEETDSPCQNKVNEAQGRHFLDLNELAPGSCFDDAPNTIIKDEDRDRDNF